MIIRVTRQSVSKSLNSSSTDARDAAEADLCSTVPKAAGVSTAVGELWITDHPRARPSGWMPRPSYKKWRWLYSCAETEEEKEASCWFKVCSLVITVTAAYHPPKVTVCHSITS